MSLQVLHRHRWSVVLLFFSALFVWNNHSIFLLPFDAPIISVRDIAAYNLFPAAILLALLVGMLGAGRSVLGLFNAEVRLPFDQKLVASFALGAGLCGFAVLGAGTLGLLDRRFIGGLFGALFLMGVSRYGKSGFVGFRSLVQEWKSELTSFELVFFAGLILWGLLYGFLQSLVPITGTDDAVAYHMFIPKTWIRHGVIDYIPWMINGNWPQNTQMLYIPAILFRADSAACGIHFSFGLFTVLAILAFGREWVSTQAKFFAAACFVSMPVVMQTLGFARNDLSWSFFVFLSGMCFVWTAKGESDRDQGRFFLVLAAIFGGFAASSRYHGLAAVGTLSAAAFIFPQWTGRSRKEVAGYFGLACLVGSPWYLRNLILSHNPFFPFLYKQIGGNNWSEFNQYLLYFESRRYATYLDRILDPYTDWFSYLTHLYKPLIAGHVAHYFYLPFLALILLTFKPFPKFFRIFLLAYAFFLPMIFNIQQTWWRFSIPFASAATLAMGYLREQEPFGFLGKGSGKKLLTLIAYLALVPAFFIRFRVMPTTFFGIRSASAPEETAREYFLSQSSHYYDVSKKINREIPENAKILLYREFYSYYIERETVMGAPSDQGYIQYHALANADDLYYRLQSIGITHVLVWEKFIGRNMGYGDPFSDVSDPKMLEVLRAHSELVFRSGEHAVWKLI